MKISKRSLILGVSLLRLITSPLLAEEPESSEETGITGSVNEGNSTAPLPRPGLPNLKVKGTAFHPTESDLYSFLKHRAFPGELKTQSHETTQN